ncbi:MAG: hypothetical protein ACXADB_05780 [Candidatus Hermodarchaeia archaeon]|jgi:hypothetical protein
MTQEKQAQEPQQQQEEAIFIIKLSLAQRIMRYIQSSPSPNIPVGEAMDIVQQLSRLPQATVANKEEQPKPEEKPARKTKTRAKRQ